MRKEKKAIIIFIIFLLLINFLVIFGPSLSSIIGMSMIDIRATYDTVGLRLSIDNSPPDVSIAYPLNSTYNDGTNIGMDYSVSDLYSDISRVWYNLDNGANVTLTSNTSFNVNGQGSHIIRLFANDSHGFLNYTESRAFYINHSVGNVIDSYYGGSTTDLDSLSKEEQENIPNLTLENVGYGLILFEENINLSDDESTKEVHETRKTINMTAYTNISFNRISIDTENLPQLNKPAKLTLYNLVFTNPRILRNGQVCPESVCNKLGYINGTLAFNVTSFSTYSSEETPSSSPSGGVTGGGSGSTGGGIREIIQKPIEEKPAGEKKELKKSSLFDVIIIIPPKYKELLPTDDLLFEIEVFDVKGIGPVDVKIEYNILNETKGVIYSEAETIAVSRRLDHLKSINLPEDIEYGEYMLEVIMIYGEEEATSKSGFKVVKEKEMEPGISFSKTYIVVLMDILLIFGFVAYYEKMRYKQIERIIKKVQYLQSNKKERR